MPFSFWFAAHVHPGEEVDYADTKKWMIVSIQVKWFYWENL